ncbi:MAG TPA: tetratricopeptide repeat protein, partial [Kofleriaceae bacterium]
YVAGQVALAAGDLADAIKKGKIAVDKDPRPLYAVGLARTYAAASNWPDATASLDRASAAAADQPSAVIERAIVVARSGKVTADAKLANDVRAQLAKVAGDPKKSGVSPAQTGFAFLALAELDFARNDQNAARADVKAAGDVGLDDQRFTEQAVETLYRIGQLSHARRFATDGLTPFAKSTRLRVSLARIDLAQGRGNVALAVLKEVSDIAKEPDALAVRGEAKLAAGDIEGARADLEAAQKLAPKLETAIVGRAWVELAAGDPDAARKQLVELSGSASPAVVTVNAAILRRDPSSRETAKTMLEAIVGGAPGPEVARAQLELARVYHDLGDFAAARKAYAAASQTGNFDARLESGLIMIEDRDPLGGRDTLDALLKEAGDHPTAQLVLETARARMLAGDHAGAASLLATADTMPNVPKWQLLRERGRLHLRRGDIKAAINELGSALEGCGSDSETFLLAADAATAEEKSGLTDKIKKLAPERLKGQPEAQIVTGKLILNTPNINDAEAPYRSAREQLRSIKAAPRRIAQANYGLAVVAYNKSHDPEAMDDLNLVISDDPSIYDAYLFLSDVNKNKVAAFEAAKTAVKYNPDYPRAWNVLGKLAAKNNDQATLAQAIEKLEALAPGTEDLAALKKLKK